MTDNDPRLDTGAFALNSLSPEELATFIEATESNPDLRVEADELAETAALLGLATRPVQPSDRLKSDLMAQIALTPQLPALPVQERSQDSAELPVEAVSPSYVTDSAVFGESSLAVVDGPADGAVAEDAAGVSVDTPPAAAARPAEEKARGRWFTRPITLVAAAAAAVALFIGGGAVGSALSGGSPPIDNRAASLAEIYAAPDVRSARTEVSGGGTATLVWSGQLGRSAVLVDGLPALPAGSVYEAWYINDSGAAPAGIFESAGSNTSWHVLDGTMSAGDTVGVTIEPQGGSPEPTTNPIIVISSAA